MAAILKMAATAPTGQIWLGSRLEITSYGSYYVCAKCHACITKCTIKLLSIRTIVSISVLTVYKQHCIYKRNMLCTLYIFALN